ncbi:hypothetical protein E3P92_03598 [Wallemia ichthyophaga]|nr:hypothetical protein E3P92_03598 [Wallemia ichthyophaga]TIB35855.1 hypothetical protein E3P84_01228 [Wallemia ichthyophaga]TIB42446.1 hypothetical protein E3P83_01264 [Wallemia ichthyophaga]
MSYSKVILPLKPKQFISNQQVKVSSNLFPLKEKPKADRPKIRSWNDILRAVKFFLVSALSLNLRPCCVANNENQEREVTFGNMCAYDDHALLYSLKRLPFDNEILFFSTPCSTTRLSANDVVLNIDTSSIQIL